MKPYDVQQQLLDLRKLVQEVHDTMFTEPDKYNCIIRTPHGETLNRVLFGLDVVRKRITSEESTRRSEWIMEKDSTSVYEWSIAVDSIKNIELIRISSVPNGLNEPRTETVPHIWVNQVRRKYHEWENESKRLKVT